MSEREQRVELDPLLSPEEMCRDAGISMATWRRNWRHRLPIVRISPRRIGVRRSVWRAALEQLIEEAASRSASRSTMAYPTSSWNPAAAATGRQRR